MYGSQGSRKNFARRREFDGTICARISGRSRDSKSIQRRKRKETLIRFVSSKFTALTVIAIAFFISGCTGPPLTVTQAEKVIAQTPEFIESRQLIAVTDLWDTGRTSSHRYDHCCYTGLFTFRFTKTRLNTTQHGEAIEARAEFRYFDGKWHLQTFNYGQPPNVEIVWIKN